MPYYLSQIETPDNLQYVAGLVDGFNQDRFGAALMGKRNIRTDKIVRMEIELVEITNRLEEEYIVLEEFGKVFNDQFATRNNQCFSSAMILLRKIRSGMSKMIQIYRGFAPKNEAARRSSPTRIRLSWSGSVRWSRSARNRVTIPPQKRKRGKRGFLMRA